MRSVSTLLVSFMVSGFALAQAPAAAPVGPAAEVQSAYSHTKPNILKAADKMPAESYTYKPADDVRTYARVMNHVTEAQLHTCGAINGLTADQMKAPADTADKATIVTALKASFDQCDKAYAATTDANLMETFSVFNGKRTRIGILWGNVSHDAEQYATLALYLRLKGITPPSAEK
jgi:uncharacterized damage-inducible protein DinB